MRDDSSPSYAFLAADFEELQARIRTYKDRIAATHLEGADSTQQSSESWHDNHAFEEAQRNLRILYRELEHLLHLRDHAVVVEPASATDIASIGTRIDFVHEDSGLRDSVVLGSHMTFDRTSAAMSDVVSSESPLGMLLQGARVGDRRTGRVGDRTIAVVIESLSMSEPS